VEKSNKGDFEMNTLCAGCVNKNMCKTKGWICEALRALYKLGEEQDLHRREELTRDYARELDVFECETSDELRQLGEKVLAGMPSLAYILLNEIKVGYVVSYKSKKQSGRVIHADCRKIEPVYRAYLPFDFLITFYFPNTYYMTDNQKKLLMFHELKHVGIGPKGLRVEPHDIEDFTSIIERYGLNWSGFGHDVQDILAGGDSVQDLRTG